MFLKQNYIELLLWPIFSACATLSGSLELMVSGRKNTNMPDKIDEPPNSNSGRDVMYLA